MIEGVELESVLGQSYASEAVKVGAAVSKPRPGLTPPVQDILRDKGLDVEAGLDFMDCLTVGNLLLPCLSRHSPRSRNSSRRSLLSKPSSRRRVSLVEMAARHVPFSEPGEVARRVFLGE